MKKIIVVGGGASGMMAAIHAAGKQTQVLLLEKNDRVGKKLLMTGNGKCNLGNRKLLTTCYYSTRPEFVESVLKRYDTKSSIAFFEAAGLKLRERNGGLYPYSEQASAVLDVLRMELERRGVTIQCDTRICKCRRDEKGGYLLESQDGKRYHGDEVIIACGGPAALKKDGKDGYIMARQLGLPVSELVPGLVQLRTAEPLQKAMAGVRCQAVVSLLINGRCEAKEQGELQLTDYGVSGIPVFQLSRIAAFALAKHREVRVSVDFAPEYTKEELFIHLCRQRKLRLTQTAENLQTGLLNKKLNLVFLNKCGIKGSVPNREIGEDSLRRLAALYKEYEMKVTAVNPFEQAQVCAGGIDPSVLDEHMEVKGQKGLYFTGELLDVDGICGGYNLHWAFATGTIAGKAARG